MAEVGGKAQIISPQLARAREAIGLSRVEAARRLNIEELTLHSWEEGEAFPDAEELYEIAAAYRRPIAFFFEKTVEERMPIDMRGGKGIIPGHISSNIKEGLRQFEQYCEFQWELEEVLNKRIAVYIDSVTLEDDVETIAHKVRESIGYRGGHGNNLKRFRRILNEHGIKIFGLSLPEEIDGASMWHTTCGPAILLNLSFSQPRMLFTLAHEYAHLMLFARDRIEISVLCNLNDEEKVERFCNRLASAFLIPYEEFKVYLRDKYLNKADLYNVEVLSFIAHDFKVSRHVIAIRLEEIGEVNKGFYWEIKDQLKEVRPPYARRKKEWKRKKENVLGDYYTNLALEAFKIGSLTPASLSRHMDLRLGQLGELLSAESVD